MNNDLQKRLSDYQVDPPPAAWEAIAASLDEDRESLFVKKLQNYAPAPAESCWEKVTAQLDNGKEEKENKTPGRYRKMIRIVTAAAVLILIAGGVSLLFTQKDTKLSAFSTPDTSKLPSAKSIKKDSNASVAQDSEEAESTPLDTEVHHHTHNLTLETPTIEDDTIESLEPAGEDSRYVAIVNDNGKTVKLSKKVAPVFNCADNATASNNKRCRENIQNLQQKMATSVVSPATDFAGLIDMTKTLEENQ